MDQPLSDEDRLDLQRLGADLVLGKRFRPEVAVAKAVDLVAKGIDGEATTALAMQPPDPRRLHGTDVEALLLAMLAELGVAPVNPEEAGWVKARWIAELMRDGVLEPVDGARQLWGLWETCGAPGDELTWMLQLLDQWESSVGQARSDAEREIVAFAPNVIEGAERRLRGDA